MTFSKTSGTCQCRLKCHWMGLMLSRPDHTCFSVAVSRPISDMNCLTVQLSQFFMNFNFSWRVVHRSRVGRTRPVTWSNWKPTKLKTCCGISSDFFMFTTHPNCWSGYVVGRFPGTGLSTTSHLGTGGSGYPFLGP